MYSNKRRDQQASTNANYMIENSDGATIKKEFGDNEDSNIDIDDIGIDEQEDIDTQPEEESEGDVEIAKR